MRTAINYEGLKVIQYNSDNGKMELYYADCTIVLEKVPYITYSECSKILEVKSVNPQHILYKIDSNPEWNTISATY